MKWASGARGVVDDAARLAHERVVDQAALIEEGAALPFRHGFDEQARPLEFGSRGCMRGMDAVDLFRMDRGLAVEAETQHASRLDGQAFHVFEVDVRDVPGLQA